MNKAGFAAAVFLAFAIAFAGGLAAPRPLGLAIEVPSAYVDHDDGFSWG